MNYTDWLVLIGSMLGIICYGLYKTKGSSMHDYLTGGNTLPWYQVMFSIIATQASAITFLAAPGQAYTDGMRFVQFYFGMPLAMIVIGMWFLPKFSRMKVYTAYEYLENRFDVKVRVLTASLFLLQRSMSSALTVYAPAIIITRLFGFDIWWSIILMGGIVIAYTVLGGAKAVAETQFYQMLIILMGMFIAGVFMILHLPDQIGMLDALHLGGKLGKINPVTTGFDLTDKYNLWSGLIGGFFLALSYFGTDQSQVARYLSGKNIHQSRMGLLITGFVKIPMQFAVLLLGVLLLSLYQFKPAPIFFNPVLSQQVTNPAQVEELRKLSLSFESLQPARTDAAQAYLKARKENNTLQEQEASIRLGLVNQAGNNLRIQYIEKLKQALPGHDVNDTNYIFLDYVLRYLPHGLIGLLIAVIFAASWSSTSAELNALASATVNDVYKRLLVPHQTEAHYLKAGKWFSLLWGLAIILLARLAGEMGSLIEAVNLLGSLFYGTIAGIFLSAFFLKKSTGNAVLIAAVLSELLVLLAFASGFAAFLWLNAIGCLMVVFLTYLFSFKNNLRLAS